MKQLILLLNLWGLFLLVSSCSSKENNSIQIPLVKTNTVKTSTTMRDVCYPGVIKSEDNLLLSFKVSGQLLDVLNKEGMAVKKGTLLATMDAHDYEVQFSAAEAAYQQAKQEFARISELNEARTVAPNDYEKAQSVFKQVEAKYQAAKDALAYTEIRAPFDGYIQNVYHYGKEIIQAGTPVVNFISNHRLEAEINIPVQDYKKQVKRRNAKLWIDNQTIDIQLKSLNKQANANQLYKMRFVIPPTKSSETLTAGMNCKVILSYQEEWSELVGIPVSAICKTDGQSIVWKVDSNRKVNKIPVTIIKIDHACATVTGLKDNDRIVVTGTHQLTEGQTVEIMPSASDTNIGNML